VLARRRLPEGVAGVAQCHELIAAHADDPTGVAVGIETDRGLWVMSLVAAGYEVYAVNPLAAARWRPPAGRDRPGANEAAPAGETLTTAPNRLRALRGQPARSARGPAKRMLT